MICEKCGEPIAQDALYCENCGARAALQADAAQSAEQAQNAEQARSASARKSMPLDEGGSLEQENPAPEDAARPGRKRRRAKREKMPPADPPIPPEDMIPLTTGQCVGILLALCVPVLNLVLMLKWAYAARGNESRRSLARAGLILTGVCIGASIVVLAAVTFAVSMGLVSVGGVV